VIGGNRKMDRKFEESGAPAGDLGVWSKHLKFVRGVAVGMVSPCYLCGIRR
jgi:hypothetical protein